MGLKKPSLCLLELECGLFFKHAFLSPKSHRFLVRQSAEQNSRPSIANFPSLICPHNLSHQQVLLKQTCFLLWKRSQTSYKKSTTCTKLRLADLLILAAGKLDHGCLGILFIKRGNSQALHPLSLHLASTHRK